MRFADPGVLFLFVIPVFLAIALGVGVFLRRRAVRRVGDPRTVEQQLLRPAPYLRAAKAIALVVGVAGLILSAARPEYGGRVQMLKKRGIDIVVALDFSKSMLAQDIQPSRIERAKLELSDFMEKLTGDRIGLVAFAGDTMRFPLTTDYAAATAFWKGMGPYDMPVGGTAVGKALTAATRMLFPGGDPESSPESEQGRSKVILLITDGEDHLGDPLAAAREAAERGVVIHVLGIGSDSPELIPRYLDDGTPMGYQKDDEGNYVTTALSAENEQTLQEIASIGDGRYFRAGGNFAGMAAVVEEIRKLKQHELEAKKITVYEQVFQWFLIPAALLLLISYMLPDRVWWVRRRTR